MSHTQTTDPTELVQDADRLAALHDTSLLDSDAEEVFDRMPRLAASLLDVPSAFLSIVDRDRDFYKSAHGFGEPLATTRQLEGRTFCHYAIRSPEPLIINDTKADPVYRTVPTVETLGVAAYLGVPVSGPTGHVLGSFCAIDFVPRQWSERDLAVLRELALSAEREVQLRVRAREVEARNASLEDLTAELQAQVEENRALAQSLEELRQGGVA